MKSSTFELRINYKFFVSTSVNSKLEKVIQDKALGMKNDIIEAQMKKVRRREQIKTRGRLPLKKVPDVLIRSHVLLERARKKVLLEALMQYIDKQGA